MHQVQTAPEEDSYLEITSPSKAMTESSMNRLFKERFEEELQKPYTTKKTRSKNEKAIARQINSTVSRKAETTL